MQRRLALFHDQGEYALPPNSFKITNSSFSGPAINSVREDRLLIKHSIFTPRLARILQGCTDLLVRWTTSKNFEVRDPFGDRMSPGLHVFYTPKNQEGLNSNFRQICSLLQEVFGKLNCWDAETLIQLPQDANPQTAALHYYSPIEYLPERRVPRIFCEDTPETCASFFRDFDDISTLDISFDTTSDTLSLVVTRPPQTKPIEIKAYSDSTTEVGILSNGIHPSGTNYDATLAPYEFPVGGLLHVIGREEPSAVNFIAKARHWTLAATYSANFIEPTGMHPVLELDISSRRPPQKKDQYCSLYAHLTLPKAIFADRYQLKDRLFMAAHNLAGLRHMSEPVDLEAPAYAVKTWGSTVLLELRPPRNINYRVRDNEEEEDEDDDDENDRDVRQNKRSTAQTAIEDEAWTAKVPLHLRYLAPETGGYATVKVPYPAVFWACDVGLDENALHTNPFDRANLGYDSHFRPSTTFWHLDPEGSTSGELYNRVQVPTLDAGVSATRWNLGFNTAVVVLLGFAWVLWTLFLAAVKRERTEAVAGGHKVQSKEVVDDVGDERDTAEETSEIEGSALGEHVKGDIKHRQQGVGRS